MLVDLLEFLALDCQLFYDLLQFELFLSLDFQQFLELDYLKTIVSGLSDWQLLSK